tara:strand:- start:1217 stop:1387 length:171 start_codon:yes stop_codon:yes gene_type:complete
LPDGSITNIKIRKGASASLNKEALRVIGKMSKWTLGINHGRNNPIVFTLPIHFRLG